MKSVSIFLNDQIGHFFDHVMVTWSVLCVGVKRSKRIIYSFRLNDPYLNLELLVVHVLVDDDSWSDDKSPAWADSDSAIGTV